MHATIEVGIPFFGENFFCMTGSFNPKSSENRLYHWMILVVYLGGFVYLLNQFLGEALSSQIEE